MSRDYVVPGRKEQEILLIQCSDKCCMGFLPAVPCVTCAPLLWTLPCSSLSSTGAFGWIEMAWVSFCASSLHTCSTDLPGEGMSGDVTAYLLFRGPACHVLGAEGKLMCCFRNLSSMHHLEEKQGTEVSAWLMHCAMDLLCPCHFKVYFFI